MKTQFKDKFSVYILTVLSIAVLSCTKDNEVVTPSFDVSVENTTITAGEPLLFKITGGADILTFYSGESGSEYRYRDRLTVQGTPQMEFSSVRKYGINTTDPDTTLKVLISTDFANILDKENVKSATWIDISNRATLSNGPATATEFVPSGAIDLSDFYQPDKPIYLAFKYHHIPDGIYSQRGWYIHDLRIDSKQTNGSIAPIADISSLNWGILDILNPAQKWNQTATELRMLGGANTEPENEDWIISSPIELDRVQRDRGINIKGNPISRQADYEYTFNEPGTYTVTFEAINVNRWDKKTRTKELTITVQ